MTVLIGEWVTRQRRGVPHIVESVVAGDAITRCGRRLGDTATKSGGLLVQAPHGARKCRVCTDDVLTEEI